ncbi:uncharacterized protein PFL1_00430 [Pseudozyma flocculosa PF-1]|uniref:AB hydrolase-1 domain-containing protein n=1 Tax=Pseudozyma flocculosa TaxID=84751 RepID=A0A5C3EUM9_9BASI|nr:uncharacterized protein PFL1_00430 [Pseudozyma flocculosa PF-1]EPQ32233.1 hypothetical protein PFL1_00430 [Pseudozyma flocculosa PF-1]SPO34819.1 uncharacterized protein PSFLO_00290 [Pseudozyma flocculosa]
MVHYASCTTVLQSLSNGYTLETQIQDPPPTSSAPDQHGPRGIALLAHPLGRLGGSLHDPVIRTLSHRLVTLGYRAVAFNSRGVGQSSGSPSWTGAGECEDIQLLLRHCLETWMSDCERRAEREVDVVVVGYSAGGLYASKLDLDQALRGYERRCEVRLRLVLVSYPLDVVWALSIFRTASYTAGLEKLLILDPATASESSESTATETVAPHPASLLALYGDQDQFTKVSSYDAWVERLKCLAQGQERVTAVKFQGADHFWRSKELLDQLADTVERWLQTAS